jgi:uncharacterized membrane protein
VPFTLAMSSKAATWLLSTVAGAMITTVGVVFSLAVVTVVGIIAHLDHLDHLARGLQVGNVARAIAVEGENVVATLERVPAGLDRVDPKDFPSPRDAVLIDSRTSGWISQVDSGRLLSAILAGTTVRLETRVGAYIHAGEPLFSVWPAPSQRDREQIDGAIEITDALAGPVRPPTRGPGAAEGLVVGRDGPRRPQPVTPSYPAGVHCPRQ